MPLSEQERKEAVEVAARLYRQLSPAEREKVSRALAEAVADFLRAANPPREEVLGLMHEAFRDGFHAGGGRLAKIDGIDAVVEVPAEVMVRVDGVVSARELEDILYTLPWSRRWSEAVAAMAYGPEWASLPAEKREEIQRRLIREKLIPAIRR
jgi:hypothetical protein